MPIHEVEQDTLLIVDDTPENIRVLFDFLIAHNFRILVAENGEDAIENAEEEQPDLILLDVMMPGIDGFETCRILKKNSQTQDIPVIFMTALSDTLDKVKAFKLGAVDYVTKPFQQEEVLARINTHLTLRKLQKRLQTQNEQLVILNQNQNEFLGIAAHDLKNPLSAIQGTAELIETNYEGMSKEELSDMIKMISVSSRQMFELIKNLLDVNAIESGKLNLSLSFIDVLPAVQWLVNNYIHRAKTKDISIQFDYEEKPYQAFVDYNSIYQVLDNLISNAIKYSSYGKQVSVRLIHNEKEVCCEIQDEGPGLSESDQKKLFGKFARLTPQPTGEELSTGLGLFIVKKLVDAMNGTICCESELGKGTIFKVNFPITEGSH
jgi:two-component system, sensor histidine kinase and response regulator